MRIPTEPGARRKQKPYRLSHKENEALWRQLPILIHQQVGKEASGPTDFLSPVRSGATRSGRAQAVCRFSAFKLRHSQRLP